MSSTVNEVNGENLQDPPIKNSGYASALLRLLPQSSTVQIYMLGFRLK